MKCYVLENRNNPRGYWGLFDRNKADFNIGNTMNVILNHKIIL